jgi:prepilin-type N-terminal cleavage/methylation domain-containing protein
VSQLCHKIQRTIFQQPCDIGLTPSKLPWIMTANSRKSCSAKELARPIFVVFTLVVLMSRRSAFTLVELLVVLAVISLLTVLLVPSVVGARALARQATCTSQLHSISTALATYLDSNNLRFPPFGFSDSTANLPLSSHWGGIESNADPLCKSQRNFAGSGAASAVYPTGLWAVHAAGMLSAETLMCPSSPVRGGGSYFPYTRQFSSYSLRFPYSRDVFINSPAAMCADSSGKQKGKLLDAYIYAVGGQNLPFSKSANVPLLRQDRTYKIEGATGPSAIFDPAASAIIADEFWMQDHSKGNAGKELYAQRIGWCHGTSFNVLFGNGSIKTVQDDGTVAANSCAPAQTLANDNANYSTYYQASWAFFEKPATK